MIMKKVKRQEHLHTDKIGKKSHNCKYIKNNFKYFVHKQSDEETTPTYQGDNEQERKLVDEITAPAGVRAAPPKEDLKTFISRYIYL